MPVALIARMAFPYAGRSLQPGDLFSASESDAKTLKLIGRAADAPRLRRKDLTAEGAPTSKRTYQRRDLTIEPAAEPTE